MIILPQGFKIVSKEPIDARLVLTKEQMATIKDTLMPQVYFTICLDDGQLYVYNKSNSIDEKTGKYRLYAASTSGQTANLEWGRLG